MFGLGWPEIALIFLVLLLFYGPAKLPEIGRSLGKGITEFKKASQEIKKAITEEAGMTAEKRDESKHEG